MAETRKTDWDGIEREYRAGIRTLREIGAQFGISHVAIQRRAKRDGWARNLSAKIAAAAEAKVNKEAVTKERTAVTAVNEREIIEANAELQAGIIRAHRTDIQRSRSLAIKLLDELETQTDNLELFKNLGELIRAESASSIDKLNDAFMRVISLPSRIDGIKKLSETLKTLVGLERQAFGLADNANGDADIDKKAVDTSTMSPEEAYKLMLAGSNVGS